MKILGFILLLLPTYLFGQLTINKENLSKPEFTYWDFNKQLIQSVGSYYKDQLGVNNDKHGTWKYYDKFGKLEEERTFFRGKLNGKVILYADKITNSINRAIGETDRRREKQKLYNIENNITPVTISSNINDLDY